jgi:hypothetical protein
MVDVIFEINGLQELLAKVPDEIVELDGPQITSIVVYLLTVFWQVK